MTIPFKSVGSGDLVYWADTRSTVTDIELAVVIRDVSPDELADAAEGEPDLASRTNPFWVTPADEALTATTRPAGEPYPGPVSCISGDWIIGVLKATADGDVIGGLYT